MERKIIDQVYETLTGMVEGIHAVPNVPNAFEMGSFCMKKMRRSMRLMFACAKN